MTSTQHSPHIICKQPKTNNEKQTIFNDRPPSFFCQYHISSNICHARTDWLQYWINLVTRVPVNFKQKTNIYLNNWLAPQLFFVFSACTWYANWSLFCVVSWFSAENRIEHGNPIESNNYIISEINWTIIVIITIKNT